MQGNAQYADSEVLADKLKIILQSDVAQEWSGAFIGKNEYVFQIGLHFGL